MMMMMMMMIAYSCPMLIMLTVQPDSVIGLTYTLNEKTSLIQWQQPHGGHGYDTALVYMVAYFSQWHKVLLQYV